MIYAKVGAVTFPVYTDYQLILVPGRDSVEAAAWGAALMAYAAFYPNVHVSRDPQAVDWAGYRHVTIINLGAWPDDLLTTLKQTRPQPIVDLIAADTPAALTAQLDERVRLGQRYGPLADQREPSDWAAVWPPERCLVGIHGRSDGELQPADLPLIARGRFEAVKLLSYATMQSVNAVRAINPATFFLIRAFVPIGEGRRVTPEDFFEFTASDVARLYDADPALRYIELHNEPNLRLEGWGGSWADGSEFSQWFLRLLDLYRRRFPEARIGFPGLSPGPFSEAGGRFDSETFLSQCETAARQCDWIGVHAYWVNEREIADEREGFGFVRYRARFPDKLLFVTEFGNPQESKPTVAEQYRRYYAALRAVPGLGGAFAYVISTSSPVESPRWAWRSEDGTDVGIAAVVGDR